MLFSVLGTCATFSNIAPLARAKKGGASRGGKKVKKVAQWPWREKNSPHFRILEPNFACKSKKCQFLEN